jgi:hypothetical protein
MLYEHIGPSPMPLINTIVIHHVARLDNGKRSINKRSAEPHKLIHDLAR